MIHLLKRTPLRLRHEKETPHTRQNAEYREEDVRPVPGVLDQRGRNQADYEVVEPVGAVCNRHAFGAQGGGEYFYTGMLVTSFTGVFLGLDGRKGEKKENVPDGNAQPTGPQVEPNATI